MESVDPSLTPGLRILVIEDEALIGMMLASMLEDLGCIALGPATNIAEALAVATELQMDAAVLDLNLKGVSALPVADVLRRRGIPIILSSGYGDLPEGVAIAALRKPYDADALEVALRKAFHRAA